MIDAMALGRIAEAYAASRYAQKHGADYVLKLRVVLDDPAGHFYQAEYPSPLRLTGDAGFFVSANDGAIVHLGTGDFSRVDSPLSPPSPEAQLRAALQRAGQRR